jgi:nucleoside-diphosphate-sugar epimerase
MATKLIFGCGYLGCRVARRWHDSGHDVYVVTRSSKHARDFEAAGLRPIVADVTVPASLVNLPSAESVLYAVGYDRTANTSLEDVYVNGLSNALTALPPDVGGLLYISSTGVYGSTNGDTFDEDSPCRPDREGGRACLAAEQVLAKHPLGRRSIILRLAGLYGPSRIPRRREIALGLPLPVPFEGYLNLIHVDDAVSAVLAAEARGTPPRTYVVSDGHPVIRRAYYEELARLLSAPAPQFETPPENSAALARARVDKCVSNARVLRELGLQLAYPSYREGLAAIIAAEAEAAA